MGGEGVDLVVFQHGSHGEVRDFATVAAELDSRYEWWGTDTCKGFGTDAGVDAVAEVVAQELDGYLVQRLAEGTRVRVALVGHSMGGLVLRAVLARSAVLQRVEGVEVVLLLTLASPHVGVRQLSPPLLWGAWVIGQVFSRTYRDMLQQTDTLDTLCNDAHLEALGKAKKRVLVSNVCDPLVSYNSSSLLLGTGRDHADHSEPPPGALHVKEPVHLPAGEGLPAEHEVASAFATCTDMGAPLARKAARQLLRLRSALSWTVIPVDLTHRGRHSHTDLIAAPTKGRCPEFGRPYASFVAGLIHEAF